MERFGDCLRKRVMGSSFKENVARPGPTDLQAQELEHRRLFHATEDMTRMPRTVTSGSAYTVNRICNLKISALVQASRDSCPPSDTATSLPSLRRAR